MKIKKYFKEIEKINEDYKKEIEEITVKKETKISNMIPKEELVHDLSLVMQIVCQNSDILENSSAYKEKEGVYRLAETSPNYGYKIGVIININEKNITYAVDYNSDNLEVFSGDAFVFDDTYKISNITHLQYPCNYNRDIKDYFFKLLDIVIIISKVIEKYN